MPPYVRIDTEGDLRFNAKLRALSRTEDEALTTFIKEALPKGWIEKTSSGCTSAILFEPKKNGKLRLCVDYRPLNEKTKKSVRAPPPSSLYHTRIAQASYRSVLDIKDAYYHLKILPEHRWKTAFRCQYGSFQFCVMPFGLTNAPFFFQKYIEEVLQDFLGIGVYVHLDDIMIIGATEKEHDSTLAAVETRLRNQGLRINEEKSRRKKNPITFCGRTFNGKTSRTSMTDDTLQTWPTPRGKRELQQFIGVCNWHRDYIPAFAQKAAVLYNLLKKDNAFHWTETHDAAFQNLRRSAHNSVTLSALDLKIPVIIWTDASQFGIAAIMTQANKPVYMISRTLTMAERNYDTRQRELLAVVYATDKWFHILEGIRFTVHTDHKNLAADLRESPANRRLNRWILQLGQLQITWKWVPGKVNIADLPSRRVDYKRGEGKAVRYELRSQSK